MGSLSGLLIIPYSLVISAGVCLYLLDVALLDSADFLPFLAVFSLAIALLIFGEVVLHKLTLRVARHEKRNILVTLPASLFLQLLFLAVLVGLRNHALLGPIIRHRVFFGLSTLAAIFLANFVSIRVFGILGLGVTTDRYVKLAHAILLPIMILVPAAMYFKGSSPSDRGIMLITIDSWRYDELSFFTPDIVSPNIDRLRETGVTFENHCVQAPYTWPSLSSIMTSLESPSHGVRINGQPLDDRFATLAEVLAAHGYRCFASADINLHNMGLTQGFGDLPSHRYFAIRALCAFSMTVGRVVPQLFERYCFAPNSSMLTTMKTLDFLRHCRSDKFFTWVHYYNEPHAPYIAPTYYTDMYNKGQRSWVDGRTELINALRGYPEHQHLVAGKTLGGEDLEYLKNLYDAEVTTVDVELGMILDNLRRSGLLDNVLIVLTADHGEDFGERGQFLHGSNLYGGLLHVPLIIKMPQQTENVSVSSLVRAIDIAPTILDFAGIAVPPQFHGSSMLDVPGRDDGTRSERWSFAETLEYGLQYPYDGYAFSYTSAKYKYICAPLEAQEQLYDLETDPHERLNIAGANRETVLKIREDIKDYFGLENVRELIPLHKPEIGEKQLKMLRTLGYVN